MSAVKTFVTLLSLQLAMISFAQGNEDFLSCLINDKKAKQKELVILYRPDCPYCNQMNQVISADQAFQKELTRQFYIRILNIYTDEGRRFADQNNIHAVPTIVSLDQRTGSSHVIKGFGSITRMRRELGLDEQANMLARTVSVKSGDRLTATCGNGILETGEQFDDGNLANGDGLVIVPSGYSGTINLSASGTAKLVGGGSTVRVSVTSSSNSSPQPIVSGKFSGHKVY